MYQVYERDGNYALLSHVYEGKLLEAQDSAPLYRKGY